MRGGTRVGSTQTAFFLRSGNNSNGLAAGGALGKFPRSKMTVLQLFFLQFVTNFMIIFGAKSAVAGVNRLGRLVWWARRKLSKEKANCGWLCVSTRIGGIDFIRKPFFVHTRKPTTRPKVGLTALPPRYHRLSLELPIALRCVFVLLFRGERWEMKGAVADRS